MRKNVSAKAVLAFLIISIPALVIFIFLLIFTRDTVPVVIPTYAPVISDDGLQEGSDVERNTTEYNAHTTDDVSPVYVLPDYLDEYDDSLDGITPHEISPTIYGVRDITAQRFGILLLRQGVSAYDAFGYPLDFFVNSNTVDVETPGVYQIIYYTYDMWGNRTEEIAHVTITDVDMEWVYAQVDTILAGITNDMDSQVEQARAVYNWMRRNMTYSATIGLVERYENAYQGLRHRRGNCFVYYYTAEIMLTRLGIPNRRIDRYGGETNHRWHLINPDDLGWFHLDTGPQNLAVAGRFSTFMFTSSEAAEFTELIARVVGRKNSYTYDILLHPYITP